jgi:23S rRNA pseudouridine1911/1915/1917 synthase
MPGPHDDDGDAPPAPAGGSAPARSAAEIAADAAAEKVRGEVVVERELTGTHRRLTFTIPKNHAPPHGDAWRLDRYVHALMPTISRSLIQKWLENGAATIDGAPAKPRALLKSGMRIQVTAPLPARDPDARTFPPLSFVYRDQWMAVVNKPPGQLAHQAGRTMTGTLVNQLQDWAEAERLDPRDIRLVNRIDRDTSGLVLVSLDVEAHTRLGRAIEAHDLRKEYRAITHGVPREPHGAWHDPIGPGDERSIARVVRPDGQDCWTDYECLASAPAEAPAFSLLRLRLHTGRQHQIRVHAAHNGLPLVGDWVYGKPCAELPGQALHAARLGLAHPMTGAPLDLEAPLPAAFTALWRRLQSGASPTDIPLSAEQKSKLGLEDDRGLRRPRWLSAEEFAKLREETGE